MARTDDGEFELILGNRQLLSVFFIVVVLLGVFFTMGYIVGKNSVAPENFAKREPIVLEGTGPGKEPAGTVISPKSESSKPSALDPATTKPESTEPKPVPAESVAAQEAARREAERKEAARREEARLQEQARIQEDQRRKAEAAKKEEKKEPPRKSEPAVPMTGSAPVLQSDGTPAPGQQFLQVVASTRPDCEFIAGVLKRKGLVATVVPGPDPKLFRVVVGPLSNPDAIARTRGEIEKAGFQNPYLKKY